MLAKQKWAEEQVFKMAKKLGLFQRRINRELRTLLTDNMRSARPEKLKKARETVMVKEAEIRNRYS